MKSLKLFLGAVLGLGLIIGTSGMSFAGAVCLDIETFCNDLKIYTTNDYSGKLVSVYGYEYGCSQPGRAFTGVLVKSTTTRQYILTGNWNDASQVGTFNITIDKETKTGTGYYNFGGGANLTTFTQVTCPPGMYPAGLQALEIAEPDASQQ
jgi:hypothetical protein